MASDGETVMLEAFFQGVRVGGGKLRVVGEVNGCGRVVQTMGSDGKIFYGHKVCGLFFASSILVEKLCKSQERLLVGWSRHRWGRAKLQRAVDSGHTTRLSPTGKRLKWAEKTKSHLRAGPHERRAGHMAK